MKKFIVINSVNDDEYLLEIEIKADICIKIDPYTIIVNGAVIEFPDFITVKEI